VDFTIGEDGRVTRAEVLDDELSDKTRPPMLPKRHGRVVCSTGRRDEPAPPFVLSPDDDRAE
jgi:hypothetical protein